MWPFSRSPRKEELRGEKRISVNGMRFTIRRVNPIIDFPADRIPQIFTDFVSRRPKQEPSSIPDIKKAQEDMYAIIRAGVVSPELSTDAKSGITVDDLFRDPTLGPKLYIEILAHSLNTFRGIRGFFLFHKIKLSFWMEWLRGMELRRQASLSQATPR